MPTLALLRHGQSRWNLENRFTGWWDVELTGEGESEARRAGVMLRASGVAFDRVHTSVLTRAIRTATLALESLGEVWLPMVKEWRLNERHYGALTGLNKAETAAKHGDQQVHVWRRSFDVPPPPIEPDNPFDVSRDRRYAAVGHPPLAESLKQTLIRVTPYLEGVLLPELQCGANLLVVAHGNSLRAVLKQLMKISDAKIVDLEIPTANPLVLDIAHDLSVRDARYLDETRAAELVE
jgi:2,3-bisphosphoglycerate-dependent phosphoglycerate mutase